MSLSLSPSPSLPGPDKAIASRNANNGQPQPPPPPPSGLSRLAFAQASASIPHSPSRPSLAMTRDSSSGVGSGRPSQPSLQSFLEGIEFATRCTNDRRGESRAASRQPSRMGPPRCDSTLECRPWTHADEEAFLSDEDEHDAETAGNLTLLAQQDDLQVFDEGDRLCVGDLHDGSRVVDCFPHQASDDAPTQLEVVRKLGSGSYAVVYLACAIASSPSTDDDVDLDDGRPVEYGKEYALKCLCKKNLTDDLLEVQRFEATLHQSLPSHPNIVAMHGAFETDKWLFLLLEYCPGQDLFYWLEQARDHEQLDTLMHPSASFQTARAQHTRLAESFGGPESHSATPPSPTLLSITAMSSLLSRRRLRLISRMFVQMCEAVDACHRAGISHRDIKPENFICCDDDAAAAGLERRVTVKLTDWGLGTAEAECGDFDCGSKPYMAYECRNNLAPTYQPRAADIWSLGIVLINLLFHRCPWADPSLDDPDFAEYRASPIRFLNDRFRGIGPEVSSFLATRVLNCDGPRASASDLARWAAGLVRYMSQDPNTNTSPRHVTVSDAAVPLFASREAGADPRSLAGLLSQAGSARPSRRTSLLAEQFTAHPGSRRDSPDLGAETAALALDAPFDGHPEPIPLPPPDQLEEAAPSEAVIGSDAAMLAAKAKRRKRGARRGRSSARPPASDGDNEASAKDLARASQTLARELSRQSSAAPALPKPKSGGLVSKFRNLKNGNPDLEAFIAKAKEREATRDAGTGAANSAPGRIQQINSFGSARSFGSSWSAEDDKRSHWASTSNRRERLTKQPISPVTSSTSTSSSPSSKYSESSFTSVSSYIPPPARPSKAAPVDGDATPQPGATPKLHPVEDRFLPSSRNEPVSRSALVPSKEAHPPSKDGPPEKSKFNLRQLFK